VIPPTFVPCPLFPNACAWKAVRWAGGHWLGIFHAGGPCPLPRAAGGPRAHLLVLPCFAFPSCHLDLAENGRQG